MKNELKALSAKMDHLLESDRKEGKVLEELVAYFKRKDETETQKTVDEIMEMIKEGGSDE